MVGMCWSIDLVGEKSELADNVFGVRSAQEVTQVRTA